LVDLLEEFFALRICAISQPFDFTKERFHFLVVGFKQFQCVHSGSNLPGAANAKQPPAQRPFVVVKNTSDLPERSRHLTR
jgi:hypothetical protein